MFRYLRLWVSFFKNCLAREMEFRTHFVLYFLVDVAWYGVQIALFQVLFLYTPSIGGLKSADMTIFLGTLFIVDGINMMMISTNFWRFPGYVVSGELDFYVNKPVSPFFMTFFRYTNVASVLNLLTAIAFLIYGIHISANAFSFGQMLLFGVMVISGTVILLAMQTVMASISIFLVNAEGIQHIFHSLYQFAMKPSSIYSRSMQRMFLSIFPMALVASVPARVLYDGSISTGLIVWHLCASVLFITLATRFFNWSLKYYSGASS